jgi:L-ascorbate metabolism protein UlaG (beta-lactamase superfamily)
LNRRSFFKIAAVVTAGSFLFNEKLFAESNLKYLLYKPDPAKWKNDEINIAWIGHATVLINFYGKIILTDPALFAQVGIPLVKYKLGPKRAVLPALELDEIPKPDVVLISHAHMDHMDYETLEALTNRFPDSVNCITAKNTKDIIDDLQWKSLIELDWTEKIFLDDISFTGIEVVHNGWRYPGEKDRSSGNVIDGRSYNGYVIERKNRKIFFGGDTAFTEKFKTLKNENIDIAIFPIGGYVPKFYYHCNPKEALIMADEFICAKYFVPIHAKTFEEKDELDKPLKWLNEIKSQYKIKVVIDDIGQTFTLKN